MCARADYLRLCDFTRIKIKKLLFSQWRKNWEYFENVLFATTSRATYVKSNSTEHMLFFGTVCQSIASFTSL